MNPFGVEADPNTESVFFNAARPTVVLLVEGESDARYWEGQVHRGRCEVRATSGRPRALEQIRIAREEGRATVIAVLDADFDHLLNRLSPLEGVFWTDDHDLEVMQFRSTALDKVLAQQPGRDRRAAFVATGRDIRDHLFQLACPLGRLRLHNEQQALNLSFRKATRDGFSWLSYADFCDKDTLTLDDAKLVTTVLNFNQRHDLRQRPWLAELASLPDGPLEQLCNGHDLLGLLAVGLRKVLGTRNLSPEDLQERLQLAHEQAELLATALGRGLRAWEAAHPGYRILR